MIISAHSVVSEISPLDGNLQQLKPAVEFWNMGMYLGPPWQMVPLTYVVPAGHY